MENKVLLVEGVADSDFYRAYCRVAKVQGINVLHPKSLGAGGNGGGNAIALLPSLIAQLKDARLLRLAMVIDSDYRKNGAGFSASYKKVTDVLRGEGYIIPDPYPNGRAKFIFDHSDGLPSFGLWVMPDNAKEGMVEDMVGGLITDLNQQQLFGVARKAVRALTDPLFDTAIHTGRAEIYTWLAWQKTPGKSLASVIGDKLVDPKVGLGGAFSTWLKQTLH